MSRKKKPNSRRPEPTYRAGSPWPAYAPPAAGEARLLSGDPLPIGDLLAAILPPDSCPECGNDHVHSTMLDHGAHDAEMRPEQRARAIELRNWGCGPETILDWCCGCTWLRAVEHGVLR